jgi:hypothetical protein
VDGARDVHFALRSSPYGAVSHGHNDQNCFVLEAYGEPLAIATGYYNRYGSPHHTQWTQQTKAKCGITHDGGQGQDRGWHAQGKITAFAHGESFDLVIGDATEAYASRLSRAIREVVHVRPGLFVIRDSLASEEPRRFEFWLHALDEMALDQQAQTVVIQRPKATLTARFVHPEALALSQTDQFDPPPRWPPDHEYANNWHVTAALPEPAPEAEFLTVLMPAQAGEEGDLPEVSGVESDTARGVELQHADGARTVVGFALPSADGDIALGDLTTDARVFAVSFSADGTPQAGLVHGGQTLKAAGRELGVLR